MRAVLQRVNQARVEVDGLVAGSIDRGLLVFLGIAQWDDHSDAEYLLEKITNLRVFQDANGKMNLNVNEAGGGLLLISQFTLYGDCTRGRRPSFDDAAPADRARLLYEYFVARARETKLPVETGVFQAMMSVYSENDGPVTLICESPGRARKIV